MGNTGSDAAPEEVAKKAEKVEYLIEEVAKHKHKRDCWIVIHGWVLDVTEFLEDHPGGSTIILDHAGAANARGTPGCWCPLSRLRRLTTALCPRVLRLVTLLRWGRRRREPSVRSPSGRCTASARVGQDAPLTRANCRLLSPGSTTWTTAVQPRS